MSDLLATFSAKLQRTAFAPSPDNRPRIGVEVELIPVDAATRRPAPIIPAAGDDAAATLPILRAVGSARRWREVAATGEAGGAGIPSFVAPGGGRITYEPGGQIEYSAPPSCSASDLLADVRDVVGAVTEALAAHGLEVLTVGIDPLTPVEHVPLRLSAPRYRRMASHFAAIGPHGARMMRQTASVQVCLSSGAAPAARWRLLNALAPYVVAVFANSPVYDGVPTGHQSVRRSIWGALDPRRTGLLGAEPESAAEYAAFALQAPAILLGGEDPPFSAFSAWAAGGAADDAAWSGHLTTLFPEVRPRGYFECRSCDALPPAWYGAPIAFLAGLAFHPASAAAAWELAGPPDAALLERAGRCGMTDPAIASVARQLAGLALDGCSALGPSFLRAADIDDAAAYFDRFTARGRSPASETLVAMTV